MWFAVALCIILFEGIKQIFSSSEHRSVYRIVSERVSSDKVPIHCRPTLLAYVVLGGLRTHDYNLALDVLTEHRDELPWTTMSNRMLRQVFEVGVIFGRKMITQDAFAELGSRSSLKRNEIEAMDNLQLWINGRLNESTVDLSNTYFAVYPAYDEWFKGQVLSNTGRLQQAKEHFRKCLILAGPEAAELREEVRRRL